MKDLMIDIVDQEAPQVLVLTFQQIQIDTDHLAKETLEIIQKRITNVKIIPVQQYRHFQEKLITDQNFLGKLPKVHLMHSLKT